MFTLKTDACFDSAHFLSGYEGKCANIHGHRWSVQVEVSSEELSKCGSFRGMVVDFSKLKQDLKDITNNLDHCLIIEKGSLREKTLEALLEENFKLVTFDFRPTAENFAKYFYECMSDKGYSVKQTTVYETPKNCATYTP